MRKQKTQGNLQLLNTIYDKPKYRPEDKNQYYDILTYVYRDESTGKKSIKEVISPKFSYYVIKEECETNFKLAEATMEELDKRNCRYQDLLRDMCIVMGKDEEFKSLQKRKEFGKVKEMTFHSGLFFGADINIEDYSINQWILDNPDAKNIKLSKSYLDIECDTTDYKGFPDEHEAPCPINVITYVNADDSSSHTFILRKTKRPETVEQIKKLEKACKSGKYQEYLKKKFEADFGEIKYNFYFYDSEIELLEDCLQCINEYKADYCGIWNMTFDILTMINRWEFLTGRPKEELFCHPDFSNSVCNFYEDNKHQKHGDKNTAFTLTSYTQFVDLLIIFAAIRRGMGERESYKLTDICLEEIGQTKEKFDDDADNLTDLINKNFRKFITYNIKDVLLMKKLEEKNNDIDTLYQISLLTGTRFSHTMRKTVSLANLKYKTFLHQGRVPWCNMNTNYTENNSSAETFEGALVADPNLNAHEGIKIYGNKSMFIFDNVIDFDLAALYPNIIRAFNVSITTQFGKLIITDENQITQKEGERMVQAFMEGLNSRDYGYIGIRFFGLDPIEKLCEKLEEEMGVS